MKRHYKQRGLVLRSLGCVGDTPMNVLCDTVRVVTSCMPCYRLTVDHEMTIREFPNVETP